MLIWVNSAAIRIPKPLLKEVGLEVYSSIEIRAVGKRLVIDPLRGSEYTLDTLLAGITAENLHNALDFGKPSDIEVK